MCVCRLHWDHIYPWKQLVRSYDVPIESYDLIRQLTVIFRLSYPLRRRIRLWEKKREFWWDQRLPRRSAEKTFRVYHHPMCVFTDFIEIISIRENDWWGHTMSQSKVMASYVIWQWFLGFHTHLEGNPPLEAKRRVLVRSTPALKVRWKTF